MLPVINATSAIPTPPPIVNTTTPGTNETRVPPTTVAPSFSSPQVDYNARGNTTTARPKAQTVAPQPLIQINTRANVGVPQSVAETFTLGAQTNFLAQLIGQDITPSVQGVLAQYEKLVNIGNVKYGPSDAFKPEEQPAGLFGKFITETQTAAPQRATATAQANIQTSPPASIAAPPRQVAEVQNTRNINKSTQQTLTDERIEEDTASELQNTPAPKAPPRAISAYLNTASRVNSQGAEDRSGEDLVSQVA